MSRAAPSLPQAGPSILATRILAAYETLSRQERQLADTVLERIRDLAGYTATELATQACVSKATATRLFRHLGYQGFEEARLEARGDADTGSPLHAFHTDRPAPSDEDVVAAHAAVESRNLVETMGMLSPTELARAVEMLAGARKTWVVGFRDSYALALYAKSMLVRVLDNVVLIPGDGGSHAEDLIGMGKADVLVAIGFRRTPRMFTTILKEANARGTRAIVLAEPGARLSLATDVVFLRCRTAGSVFDSHAAGLSLLNLVCSRVARALGAVGKSRLEAAEALHQSLQDLPVHDRRPG